jgi:PhnB protein
MAQLHVYLTFNGNAREAMEFYASCIGGDLNIMTFGDAPDSGQTSEEMKNRVMHATLSKGDFILMASDTGGNHPNVTTGSSITLSLNCTSDEEITGLFAKISAGGTITMPLEDTFWGAKFGMFNDQFGIPWMLNYDKPKN